MVKSFLCMDTGFFLMILGKCGLICVNSIIFFFLFSFSFVYDAHMWGGDGGGGVVEERLCLSTYGPEVDMGSHLHCSSFLFSEAGSVDHPECSPTKELKRATVSAF